MTDRRSFVAWLGSLTTALRWPRAASPTPVLRAVPTALYRQPDGRSNLVRVTVTGLDAPAARARLTDRRGALVGTAGLLPDEGGTGLAGEVWVPLAEPVLYQIDLEVGKQRVVRQRDRKSTRLNSSHPSISYAVFCLKKKKKTTEKAKKTKQKKTQNTAK